MMTRRSDAIIFVIVARRVVDLMRPCLLSQLTAMRLTHGEFIVQLGVLFECRQCIHQLPYIAEKETSVLALVR